MRRNKTADCFTPADLQQLKLLSLKVLCVRGTMDVLSACALERKKTRPCLTDYEVMSCPDGSLRLERRFYAESYASDGRHELNTIN